MHYQSVYKVPNGKLLKVKLELENNTISNINLNGDFFVHPEEGIEQIEKTLTSSKIDGSIIEKIDSCVKQNNIQLFGLDSKAILTAIKMAVGDTNGI